MKILTIIVTYNALTWLDKCLTSLRNSTVQSDVFIIDNGSSDGTQDYIKAYFPEVLFEQSSVNLGFGKANNIGMQYAKDNDYDYVYLLNQDAWLMPDTLELLIKAHQQNPEYGVISPMQLQANMHALDTNFAICLSEPNSINEFYFQKQNQVLSVDFVMAAHWMITKSCLRKVGGFSPTFPHYGEDNNYLHRVHYHQLKVGVVPKALAVHDREFRTMTKEKVLYFHYITMLIELSNILTKSSFNYLKWFYRSCIQSVKQRSSSPILSWFKVLGQQSIIKNNFVESKQEGAFLK